MKQLKVLCVAVLLLAAVVAEGKPPKRPSPPPPPKPLDVPVLDLDGSTTGDKYISFMNRIDGQIRLTTTTPPIKVGSWTRTVLGVQNPQAPLLDMKIRGNGKSATLTVRTDNIYLVGFKLVGGSSYAFKNEGSLLGSKPLPFEGDYAGLVGDRKKNLGSVVLGKKAAQEALDILAGYSSTTPEAEIKKALTRFVLMICEATRFAAIRAAVKEAWQDGAMFPQFGVELVVLWRDTSCAILVWTRSSKPDWSKILEVTSKHLKIEGVPQMDSVEHALANIIWLIRPTKICSDDKTY